MNKLQDLLAQFLRWCSKHVSFLKGLFALFFGVALILLAHRVIINLFVFSCGALLIYYGLTELKLYKITSFIDSFFAKLRR